MSTLGVVNILRGTAVALTAFGVVGCSTAHEIPSSWKSDCVGRMQLSFPGEIEIAGNSASMLEAEYKVGSIQPKFEFPDGQRASWSALNYLGRMYVSLPLTLVERERLTRAATQYIEQTKAWALTTKVDETGTPLTFESLSVQPRSGQASRVNAGYGVFLVVEENAIRLSSSGVGTSWAAQRKNFELLLSGAVSRRIGSVPLAPGVCLPFAFVLDDARQPREIGMTYRLREHPDVTVFLKDATAATHPRKEVLTAKYRTNDFWGQYAGDTLQPAWSPVAREVKLAGQSGMQTFVQFVRKDGTQDYGYLAVAPGDPEAKEDTPDLMLYVIRDAKNAKAKGIEPISKEALLEMAQTIATSVKRRPVTQ